MSDLTSIEWTHWTWNPLAAFSKSDYFLTLVGGGKKLISAGTRGWFCTKCSPGCLNCYAERINLRLGNGLEYKESNLDRIEWRLVNLLWPLRKRVQEGRNRVFVNSMTDLFHERVPDRLIQVLMVLMAVARDWNFQVLTKRSKRMREFFERYDLGDCIAAVRAWECGDMADAAAWEIEMVPTMRKLWERVRKLDQAEKMPSQWPLPNVWLGVSAEDQLRAEQRIPDLLRTPAAVRFVSGEPLLGAVDFAPYLYVSSHAKVCQRCGFSSNCDAVCPNDGEPLCADYGIDWLILGGESGLGARACDVDAMRGAVCQAFAAGVPVLVKQTGKRPFTRALSSHPGLMWPQSGKWAAKKFYPHLTHAKGGDPAEWPADLRVRQFPGNSQR